ncbi:hypothetical protein ARMSODRAFT_941596 [Armillaria solidipes]|uniref:Uncharacterized protein n=1 Tax=Armillaria solidipes TaxID=1076256 RepID=A0A2H3BDA1_9AGAR|nr:hypothetical protein ARMSODRAFT_941596 [Armillaria solidipes]
MTIAFCRKYGNLNYLHDRRLDTRARTLVVYKQEGRLWPPPSSHLPFNIATHPYLLFSTLLRCATVASELHLTAASSPNANSFFRVRNVYIRCGHAFSLPEEFIRCEQSNCKFSLFHRASCKPPACLQTCWQYRRFPEQYSPHIDSYCPTCSCCQPNQVR